MLLTETHNQWKTLLEREMRGEKIELESGYSEAFAEWKKSKEEVLPKLSAEERVQLFSDDLGDLVQEKIQALVSKKWTSKEEKTKRLAEARRGDLCLVSTDEGKHFDQVHDLEELQKMNPLELRYLSPTLQSLTNDPEQLKEEQNVLHVSKNLRANHCLVERAYVENHVVHVDIVHPRMQTSEVQVDLRSPDANLQYIFIKSDGSNTSIPEAQLPEEFGVLESAIRPEDVTPANSIYLMGKSQIQQSSEAETAEAAAIASYSTVLALDQMHSAESLRFRQAALLSASQNNTSPSYKTSKMKELLAKELVLNKVNTLQTAASKFSANVIESKAAMVAKFAEQQQKMQDQKVRYAQAVEAQVEAQKKLWVKRQEQKKKKFELMQKAQTARKVATAVGSAVTGGAIGGFGFLSFWIAHLNSH